MKELTPAELGEMAIRNEKRIAKVCDHFRKFAINSIQNHRANFNSDYEFLLSCMEIWSDYESESSEAMDEHKLSWIKENSNK